MIAILASLALAKSFSFYSMGPYPSGVPKPDDILGYAIGSWHSTYRDQERVVTKLAESCPSTIRMFQYGKSVEGRPLRVFVISTPENIRHLEEIRKQHAEIASGKADASLINKTVPIVWVNECIHGDETASFESAMALIYNLANSPQLQKELKDAVVIVNPVYNPDGHERYVVYYNSIATGSPENEAFESQAPELLYGRLNHYRFDMNRDRVAMSQDETRQEVAEFLRWNPQVYCDQHGQVNSYFFPPNPMSVNENVDRERVAHWTEIFGRAAGAAFDKQGWTYYVKNEFDLFYAGYLDSWTTLTGAIGMTHETDGGRRLSEMREDGSKLTLLDGIEHHFTAALAVIGSAIEHHTELMASYADYKHRAVTGEFCPTVKRYVMTGERRELQRVKELLDREGIASRIGPLEYVQKGAKKFGTESESSVKIVSPSLIVDLAQPQGPLAKAMLEPQPGFEPEFTKAQLAKKNSAPEGENNPGREGTEFYDFTGWSLPYAFNLTAYECSNADHEPFVAKMSSGMPPEGDVGFAIPYSDYEDALAASEIEAEGVRGMVLSKAMYVGNAHLSPGTFVFLAARNEEGYGKIVSRIAEKHGSFVDLISSSYPREDRWGPGSEGMILLKKPTIGIVFGTTDQPTDFAHIWYLMDRVFKLPFTPLNSRSMNAGTLAKYTTIVVPGRYTGNMDALKTWVQEGGCLVCLGGVGWASSNFQKLDEVEGDLRDLPGGLFKAQLDPRSFLSYGYGEPTTTGPFPKIEIPVPVDGSTFYKARKEGGSVVTFDSDPKSHKLLSGWDWPEETDKALADTVWLQDEKIGGGHVVIFTHDPADRAMWPGLYKMLLNAMIIGPGAR